MFCKSKRFKKKLKTERKSFDFDMLKCFLFLEFCKTGGIECKIIICSDRENMFKL